MTDTQTQPGRGKRGALLWCIAVIIFGGLIFAILSAFGTLRFWQAEKTPQGETDLRFSQAELPFTHEADLENSLPFLASAAFDINGDGRDELFIGGGDAQADQFLEFKNGGFVPLSIKLDKGNVDATHGAAALDLSLIHI